MSHSRGALQVEAPKFPPFNPRLRPACFDRLVPRAKHSPVAFPLPPIASPTDAIAALCTIVQGVSEGEITAIEAAEMAMVVRSGSQIASESNLEQRIRKIEETDAAKDKSKTP